MLESPKKPEDVLSCALVASDIPVCMDMSKWIYDIDNL